MSASVPVLRLALPGSWVQVPLDDQVRVDRVVELVGQSDAGVAAQETLRAVLQQLAASGGDQLYLRQDPTVPTVLVTAWQDVALGSGDDPDALREALGLDASAAPLPRVDGAALRVPRPTPGCSAAASYWITLPGAEQVLALSVFLLGSVDDPEEQQFYDRLAGSVTWESDERASA